MSMKIEESLDKLISFQELEQLNIPTNENLRKILEPNLKNIETSEGSLLDIVEGMIRRKCYRHSINGTEVWVRAAEDIAKSLIRDVNNKKVGITGNDFLICELYELPSFGLTERVEKEGEIYKDPRKLIEYNLLPGRTIKFKGKDTTGDKIIEMIILKYNTSPRLCILGAGDETYKQLKKRKKENKEKIEAVVEQRLYNIARATLENDKDMKEIGFNITAIIRTTEGYIRKNINEVGKADIGVEIGETFSTAKANGLQLYEEIMQTYPILLKCYRP